ncbi:MAG: site-specific integrase [Lachnospiraceae bacterium]|nr:site-specific integrase [Lachnospiraceae bacterium]
MHKVRKTYATNLLNAGFDDKLVELQMGHTEIRTTKNTITLITDR